MLFAFSPMSPQKKIEFAEIPSAGKTNAIQLASRDEIFFIFSAVNGSRVVGSLILRDIN
jgi:hypothetical protein